MLEQIFCLKVDNLYEKIVNLNTNFNNTNKDNLINNNASAMNNNVNINNNINNLANNEAKNNNSSSNIFQNNNSNIGGSNNTNVINPNVKVTLSIEKILSYSEIQEIVKKKKIEQSDKDNYYNIDEYQELVLESNFLLKLEVELSEEKKDLCNGSVSSESNISLTPSFQSQDNGKTYKNFIIKKRL